MPALKLHPRQVEKTGDDSPAGSLFGYVIRMSGVHQIWICLLAVLVAGLSLAPIELERRIVDKAIGDRNIDLLITLGLIYLGVIVLHGGLKFLLRMYQGWLSESAIRYSREHLAQIHECRQAGIQDAASDDNQDPTGKAVSIIASEVDQLAGFVGEGLSQLTVNVGLLLAIGIYMFVVEPMIALFSLPFLLLQALMVPWVQAAINRRVQQRLKLVRRLSDSISTIPEEFAEEEEARLIRELDAIYGNRMRIFLLKFSLKAFLNFLNALAPLSALAVGGYLAIQGETTIGTVVAFAAGFQRMAGPVRELANYYRVAAQAAVQHRMIARWM